QPSSSLTKLEQELLLLHDKLSPIFNVLSSTMSSTFSLPSSAGPRAPPLARPAQLDHELHLQHAQLSSTTNSTFNMSSSA
ncbi:hypothetical protein A2U01_0049998, partial [Trifolium medium]|nr:hypothetical protein [Trifolium medium]